MAKPTSATLKLETAAAAVLDARRRKRPLGSSALDVPYRDRETGRVRHVRHRSPATISNPDRRRAAIAEQEERRALSVARPAVTTRPGPRRTPAARPAARRPGTRRTSRTSRGSPSGDDSDGGEPSSEPCRGGELRHISHALAAALKERRPAESPPLVAYVRDPRYGRVNMRLAAFLGGETA